MRAMKHAILSLIRKPTKAIMIFVILFVVYGLVFTGIIIQNSVKTSKVFVRKELGAVVDMQADYMKAMQQKLSQEEYTKLNLSAALAKEIAKDPAVKELYITEITSAINEDLESAVNLGGDGEDAGTAITMSTSGPSGSFLLYGCNSDTPLDFSNGTYEITEGRLRSPEDQGKDTLLISQEFASKNNLSVGDFTDLTSAIDGQTYSFEIIGIYKGSPSYMTDQLHTSLDSAKKLAGTVGNDDNAASIEFLLNDPLEAEAFVNRHESQLPNEFFTLNATDR